MSLVRPQRMRHLALAAGVALLLIVSPPVAEGTDLEVGGPTTLDASLSAPLCRYGVGAIGDVVGYPIDELGIGWYVNFAPSAAPPPSGVTYYPMVRLEPAGPGSYALSGSMSSILAAAQQRPGQTWIIGNEPDSVNQDNLEPSVYAQAYHDLYTAIKGADPTARIAVAGVIAPTPVRLLYLDMVLASYRQTWGESMPVDVWTTHVYMIQEKSCTYYPDDCWGAEMPPGIDWPHGELYTTDDNADPDLFKQLVVDFRTWMASRGYRDRSLIITEFGVQMPWDYGFPPERVNAYMDETMSFLSTATGPNGYPADGNRLVQKWAWWSLQRPPEWPILGNGWLYDPIDAPNPPTQTVFYDHFAAHTSQITRTANLFPVSLSTVPPSLYSPTDPVTLTLAARVANDGNIGAGATVVRFYEGTPGGASAQIGTDVSLAALSGCGMDLVASVEITNVTPGPHPVYVVVDALNTVSEADETDNVLAGVVLVSTHRGFLPMVNRSSN